MQEKREGEGTSRSLQVNNFYTGIFLKNKWFYYLTFKCLIRLGKAKHVFATLILLGAALSYLRITQNEVVRIEGNYKVNHGVDFVEGKNIK